ncbi:hypothetical protein [Holdemanella porci]
MEELQTLIKKYLESLGMPSSENKKTKKDKTEKAYKVRLNRYIGDLLI